MWVELMMGEGRVVLKAERECDKVPQREHRQLPH